MNQDWVVRRPRRRAFFHPAAIFPKLSRALVNLSRVRPGEVFLDPFCGTGSLLLEAYEIGAFPVGSDLDSRMVRGARRNMEGFHQDWLGLVRADASHTPVRTADAICHRRPLREGVEHLRVQTRATSSTRSWRTRLRCFESGQQAGRDASEAASPSRVASDFELEEEHQLYIHRKLTRTISVLRRV